MGRTEPWHLSGLAETNLSTKTSTVSLVNRATGFVSGWLNCLCWPFRSLQRLIRTRSVLPSMFSQLKSAFFRVLEPSWTTLQPTWPQITLLWAQLGLQRIYNVLFHEWKHSMTLWCSTSIHKCTYRALRCGLAFLAFPEVLQKQRQIRWTVDGNLIVCMFVWVSCLLTVEPHYSKI